MLALVVLFSQFCIQLFNSQQKVEVVYSKDILHQKFIEAGLELDASIVEPFIPEDMILQDLDKYRFLSTWLIERRCLKKRICTALKNRPFLQERVTKISLYFLFRVQYLFQSVA